jgi:hypothetical protein
MFADVQHRVKKAGQSPGTAIYTGKKVTQKPFITLITFDNAHCDVITDSHQKKSHGSMWKDYRMRKKLKAPWHNFVFIH